MRAAEIFSALDPVYVADRGVRYWGIFEGEKTRGLDAAGERA